MINLSVNKQLAITLAFVGLMFYTAVNIIGVNVVPVVSKMEAVSVENGGSYFTANVFGVKIRNCEYLSQTPYIKHVGSDLWSENVYFEYLADRTPGNTKPIGKHDFGFWQWSAYGSKKIKSVKLVTEHDCRGKIVFTTIGPFN